MGTNTILDDILANLLCAWFSASQTCTYNESRRESEIMEILGKCKLNLLITLG